MAARGFDWETVRFPRRRIGDVVTLNYGKSLVEPKRRAGNIQLYGTNGPCGWHDTPLSDGPGVILGRKGQGHLGVKWVTKPFWVIDTAYYAVVDKTQVDLRWFYYATQYVGLDHLKTGEKPGLSRDIFSRQVFPFPKLAEQRAIARVLGALDDKIELNRRMNRTLEELAGALFRAWFVDFEPVVAQAAQSGTAVPAVWPAGFQPGESASAGETPARPTAGTDCATFGLAPAVAALFPATFTDSELGPIPHGWRAGKVSELASMSRGGINPGDFPTEAFDHYSLPAFDDGRQPQPELGSTIKSNKFPVPADCVLVSKLNPRTPRVWMPELTGERRAICSTEFLVMTPKQPITREFLCCLFSSDAFTSEFATFVTGTSGSHQRVKPESLTGMDAIIPPAPLVKRFTEIVRPWLAQAAHNVRESRTLAALRDSLLPKLLSGELRVRAAEDALHANV